MNRATIFAEFMENMTKMRRAFFPRVRDASLQKDLPTHTQFGILATIAHEGPRSIKGLAERFEMTSSAVTQAVHGLVKLGLLTRREDSLDRRRICVVLTKKGSDRLKKARQCHADALARAFSVLTDQELAQLQKIQQKIIIHLS